MKIGLSWKLFGVFLLNTALIVSIIASVAYFNITRNFENYVKEFEKDRFESILSIFEDEYSKNKNWNFIQYSQKKWFRGLGFIAPRIHPDPQIQSSPHFKNFRRRPNKNEGMNSLEKRHKRKNKINDPSMSLKRDKQFKEKKLLQNFSEKWRHYRPNLGRGIRREPPNTLILLDENRNQLWGPKMNKNPDLLKAIYYQGKVVGWLGMFRFKSRDLSRQSHFLERQKRMLIILSIVSVLTSGVITFFLSRYLLRPVRKLTDGTKAISARHFEARVEINSSDEFGQLASDFNSMAEKLDSFEKQRQQWISDISHELGTPLAVLRGEIEAIQDGVRKFKTERLASLHAEVMHISRIVDDLKLINRAEAGDLSLSKVETDPIKLFSETLEQFKERLSKSGIKIDNSLPAQSVKVMIDPDRFRQVFINLLENVVRYVHSPGTVKVRSNIDQVSINIYLEDSGPGVSAEELPYLFDRFYRTDLSRNRETGGSGLGLAICKNLIEAHGSSIHAESIEPKGLRIVIKIDISDIDSKSI